MQPHGSHDPKSPTWTTATGRRNSGSTSTDQESLLSRSVKAKHGLKLKQRNPQVSSLDNKPATPQNEKSLVDLSPVGDKALRAEITEILFKYEELRIGRLGTIKATNITVDLKQGMHSICQKRYRVGQISREELQENLERQLEAVVVDSAQSWWDKPILLDL